MAALLGAIRPATISQVRTGKGGRMVEIEGDVFEIAKRLHAIDRSLGVDWNDAGGYFRVTQLLEDGSTNVVLTCQELTPAIIDRVMAIAHPEYNLGAELDRKDDQRVRERERVLSEEAGIAGERLHHAFRKDLGFKPRIFLPAGVRAE